jgi:hypothetical protein
LTVVSGLDPGRLAVEHKADRAGRRNQRRLGVAETVLAAELQRPRPLASRRPQHLCRLLAAETIERLSVTLDHVQHRFGISPELRERSRSRGQLHGAAIGGAGHQRGDRRGPIAPFI